MQLLEWIKNKYHKLTRGFTDEEIWNLDYTAAEWLIPRLKYLKENTCGYPPDLKTFEEWQEILQKMIDAFEIYIREFETTDVSQLKTENEIIEEGMQLFGKYFRALWW